eukprot:TRINITY_DN10840_c0_g1_i1.p1 TRINITY_DN10840_c0_g1~~TRINITY_DN10840_c0_g1_i1.p1  ORF type:complete len:484 (+),score=157.64 TRINITY_DN10840_c0_g1_i1:63-1514(+)
MAAETTAPGLDMDMQAVENIPRETLVALLKRKDKEAKALQGKLEKLEERYVKVVRFNKILMEDRQSFQRFCHELLPESDGVFEEAAAQETAANLKELLRQLSAWRRVAETASEDRKVFRQFVELVFPADESVLQLFNGSTLGGEAFDVLQQRWMQLEDLHNQSIASINGMAREQVMAREQEHEASLKAQREAERKVQELQKELTDLARDKAQMLKQKLHGGGSAAAAEAPPSLAEAIPPASNGVLTLELQELQDKKAAAERREREAREAADRQREVMQASIDEQRAEVRRLKLELERIMEDSEQRGMQARQMLDEKDSDLSKLRQRAGELEQELTSNDFITRLAEQQAGRDAEIRNHHRQVNQLNQNLAEIQRLLNMSYSQEKVLKERIRELESSQGRSHVAGDYLKHVVLKYIEYNQTGDMKSQTLVPVLCTLLNLSPAERQGVEHPSIPQSLLLLNQAVGGAGAWFRGSGGNSESAAEPPG